jgi:hypothetical protein
MNKEALHPEHYVLWYSAKQQDLGERLESEYKPHLYKKKPYTEVRSAMSLEELQALKSGWDDAEVVAFLTKDEYSEAHKNGDIVYSPRGRASLFDFTWKSPRSAFK